MVKMENHSELEDSQISKLNECLLVADRIWKVERSSRQGFSKLNKLNPNGGGVRSSVLISNELSPFANGPLSLATPSEQSSREASPTQSVFSLVNPLNKEEGKEIRAPEVPSAPNNPAKCQASTRAAQACSERSDGGDPEGSHQRSPPEINLLDTPDQALPGAFETASRSLPPQANLVPSPSPLRFWETLPA
jgi:hypothetical protein